MLGPKQAMIVGTLLLTGCQSYVDAQGRTHVGIAPFQAQRPASTPGPGEAYVPDESIAAGVATFNDLYRREGFTIVRTTALECVRRARPGGNATLASRCFAIDVAAFIVSVSQSRARGTAPLRDLDVPSFRHRFALYQTALGVPPAVRQQVEDSVFQRVALMLGAGAP